MSTTQLRVASVGLFFVLIFLTGFWLNRSGKPYGILLFTVHKLLGLGAVIFLGVTLYQVHQATPLSAMALTAGAVTGLFFLGTIILGGLVSLDKPAPAVLSTLHKVFPYLTALATAATLYSTFG